MKQQHSPGTTTWVSVLFAAMVLTVSCENPTIPAPIQPPSSPNAAVSAGDLSAPSNTYASGSSATEIVIQWRDNSSTETGFEIHRSATGPSGAFNLITTTNARAQTYADHQGLASLAQYCYRIRAVRQRANGLTYSGFSSTACGTTLAPSLAPPSNAGAVAVSSTEIDVSWQDNTTVETGFELFSVAGNYGTIATLGPDVTGRRDGGLLSLTQYCYQVRAVFVGPAGTAYSGFSNVACTTTLTPPPPAPASGVTASPAGSSAALVSWIDNSSNEDGFRLETSMDGGLTWSSSGAGYANSTYAAPAAVEERQNCYRVIAFNAGGSAPPSNAACTTPPAAPTSLTVTRVDSLTLSLAWSDNSSVENGYQVWYFQGNCPGPFCDAFDPICDNYGWCGGTGWVLIAELPANARSYTGRFDYFVGGTGYGYDDVLVYAIKDGGNSTSSNWVRVP